jgi:adenylate kinase
MPARHNQAVAVTGMTGAGKDYLVERANAHHNLTVLNWGSLLGIELAADRDLMMDAIDPQRIRRGQFAVCRQILGTQPVVVTCHTVRPQGEDFAYDLELESTFNPLAYVFVAAPPELIHERVRRRNEWGERKSQEIPVAEIARVQDIKLAAVARLAGTLGSGLTIIENANDNLDANVRCMEEVLGALQQPAIAVH